jgi:hypothetical protein
MNANYVCELGTLAYINMRISSQPPVPMAVPVAGDGEPDGT